MATFTTVDVDRMSHTGEGIATQDGQTVLVRGALPGERVRAEIVSTGKVLRANTMEVINASDQRVASPCPHIAKCGGCDLMHASVQLQRDTRVNTVLDHLSEALGGTDTPIVKPELHSPSAPLGYRSRARLLVHANANVVQVGFHRSRSRKMAAIENCVVFRPALQPVVARLRELVMGSQGRGEALVALGHDERICIDLRWNGSLDHEVFGRADAWVANGSLGGVRVWEDTAQKPATFGDSRAVVMGADDQPLWIAPGGFAQASDEGGRLLAERVGELVALRPGGLTVELFAGSGTLTVAAHAAAERYIAVERDEGAVLMLRENLRSRGLKAKIVATDAESYVLRRPLATVILDPPRTGAVGACKNIAAARPRQIVYVSCNPATLSRDIKALSGQYRLAQLEIIELFPQTSHVETIARLVRL